MKKILLLIIGLFIFLCPSYAENFYIENYNINIDVNKNKSAKIVEDIDVYFTNSSHGIFRDIPFQNASITNVEVSENHKNTFSGSNLNIKIGDPNHLITGPHHYRISYRYNYRDNKNEFYHNIIGNGWDVDINHASFKITLPEKIDPSKAGLSIGQKGAAGFNGGAIFNINNNVISGYTKRTLSPHEGITFRVEVPEGYFNKYHNYAQFFVVMGILILTLFSFLIWFLIGKDMIRTPIVNFYTPKNLNSMELELVYKGGATSKGIIGLLIELAQAGYIKINDDDESWSIEKIKDYEGEDESKKDLLTSLFFRRDIAKEENLLKSKTFYKDCEKMINNINKKKVKFFDVTSVSPSLKALMGALVIGIALLTFYVASNYNMGYIMTNMVLLLFPTIALIIFITTWANPDKKGARGFITFWALGFGGIPLYIFLFGCFNPATIPVILFGIIGIIISTICFLNLPKYNHFGQNILNNLLGLKKFIQVAEKSRLEHLVSNDPEYFYKILPIAYILDVSDKWIKKFESIMRIQPEWYSGRHFNVNSFNRFTKSAVTTTIPSVANGGVSSSSSGGGGGCSGGGGGGGGGGSW